MPKSTSRTPHFFVEPLSRVRTQRFFPQLFVKRTWGTGWYEPFASVCTSHGHVKGCGTYPGQPAPHVRFTKSCGKKRCLRTRERGSTKKCGVRDVDLGICAPTPFKELSAVRAAHCGGRMRRTTPCRTPLPKIQLQ